MSDSQQAAWDKAADAIATAFGMTPKEAMIVIDSFVAQSEDKTLRAIELKTSQPLAKQPGNRHARRKREALARR